MRRKIHRSSRTSSPVLRRAFRPGANRLEDRTLLSTTPITWANDVSGDWDNPAMWTGGAVPGANNDAIIPFGDITVTHSSPASDSVNSISCQAALDLTNGSLALANSSSILGAFNFHGATLNTAGTLTITGTMSWGGGTVTGFGTLDIASGATLEMGSSGNPTQTLNGVELQN